jgi:diamine N-acetyltransferase
METTVQAIHFRRATPNDAAAFAALAESMFRDAFAATNDPIQLDAYCAGHYSEAIQLRELASPNVSVFFVELADQVVGYVQLEVMGNAVFLHRFYVDRAWHGRGVAQQMLEYCVGFARVTGASCIRLATWVENARAIAFYRKSGFEVIGEQPFVLGTEVQNDYLMERSVVPR